MNKSGYIFPILFFLFVISCTKPEKKVDTTAMTSEEKVAYERIETIKMNIKNEPNNVELRNQLAMEYQRMGNNAEALKTYEDGLEMDAGHAELKFNYAEFALSIGKKKRAYQAYKEILKESDGEQYLTRIATKFMDIYNVIPVIATEYEEAFPMYSPDGSRIIYQANKYGNWDIFEYDITGQTTNQITYDPTHEENPVYSPDNMFIAYTSTKDDHRNVPYEQKLRDIYIFDLNDKITTNLTSNSSNDWRPRYSRDGKMIVFVTERDDLRDVNYIDIYSHIYLMESDGDFQMQLTNIEGNDGGAVMTGGEMDPIYFDSNRNGNFAIYKMNSDGSEQRQLTFNKSANDVSPDISPDGSKIVFFSDRDGNYDLFMMNEDGTNQQKLSSNPSDDLNPIFSPDGKKIIFHSNRNGNYDIFEMDLSVGKERLSTYDVIAMINQALDKLEPEKE
jgi:Tol biopolymer transport system component